MSELLDALDRWRARGEQIVLATVIKVDGSAPRGEGAKMLVTRSGKVAGSVSGGCVESAVADEAQTVLASGIPKIVRYGINRNMMWDVGLACGGSIDVFVEPLPLDRALGAESGLVACTVVRGPGGVGEQLQVRVGRDGSSAMTGSFGDSDFRTALAHAASNALRTGAARTLVVGEHEVFVDPRLPEPRLVIVGAVHIAVALCAFATGAGFSVTVVDPRERLNNRERFPAAAHLAVGWPEDELPTLGFDENTYVAVLTHDDKFDDPTLDHVLRKSVRYVGAIGSKKTQALRRQRLLDSGLSPAAVDRLHAPIGLDIGAESPEEIAIAILAEMVAAKYGHRGMPLKDREESHIHA